MDQPDHGLPNGAPRLNAEVTRRSQGPRLAASMNLDIRVDQGHRDNQALNALRCIFALLVVLGHVRILLFEDYSEARHSPLMAIVYAFTSLGSQAVIAFFVLSGYWVGGAAIKSVHQGSFKWTSYLVARLTRLWIVLIPALLLTFGVDRFGAWVMPHADIYTNAAAYEGVPADPTYSVAALFGNIFFQQDIRVPQYGLNGPLWSLSAEFWYYAIFPAALLAVSIKGEKRIASIGILMVTCLLAGSRVLVLIPAWLIGTVVAWKRHDTQRLANRIDDRKLRWTRAVLLLLSAAAMILTRLLSAPSWVNAWLVAAPIAMFIASVADDVRWTGISAVCLNVVARRARCSYSLYAIHTPIVALVAATAVPDHVNRWPMTPEHVVFGLAVVLGLMLVAELFAAATEKQTDRVRKTITARLQSSAESRVAGRFRLVRSAR